MKISFDLLFYMYLELWFITEIYLIMWAGVTASILNSTMFYTTTYVSVFVNVYHV